MKLHKRNAITIYDDDMAYTFMKPLSEEHGHEIIMVYEDAYGDMSTKYVDIPYIKDRFKLIEYDIQELVTELNTKFHYENIR